MSLSPLSDFKPLNPMMLFFRMLLMAVRSRFRSRLGPLEASIIRLRVLPNDVDINFHLNNGRYLTMMDLGRLDFIARTGILPLMMRNRWFPLVGSAAIRFVRPLDPLQIYELHTRMLCWDDKWFYLEQQFQRDGTLAAVGWIQGLFRGKKGNISPGEVLSAAGHPIESPPMPSSVAQWQQAMRTARAESADAGSSSSITL